MATLSRAPCQTSCSKQRQSGMWAGHVGFLCTNTVGCQPTILFGSCEIGRETNFSNTQGLKDSQIPLLWGRNPWISSSTSRKNHLWCGFAVFTKNMTEYMFNINLNKSWHFNQFEESLSFPIKNQYVVFLPQNFHVKIKFKEWKLFWRRAHVNSLILFLSLLKNFHIAIVFIYNDDASTKINTFVNEKRKLDRWLKQR